MSKKHRIKKTSAASTVVQKTTVTPAPRKKNAFSFGSPELIVFKKRTFIFLSILLGLYILMSALKLHTSSVSTWDKIFGNEEPESVKAGQPRAIRQDEWMVTTPSLVGQYKLGFPASNPSLGDGNVPVIWNFPVKDLSMLLRPSLWPYFIFDVEHAFAFSWNFNIYLFLISTFLLFMLLTGNNFWLSAFGAFFIFLSGAMQWWSYSLGSLMIWLNAGFISLAYLLFSKNVKALILSGVVLVISSYSFMVSMYPPWQAPLVYLYAALLIGFVLQRGGLKNVREKGWWRLGILLSSLLILSLFLFHFYGLVKHTYEILLNTVYPGRRTTNGGDLVKGKLFSEFYGMYMTDVNVPPKWLNICEASSIMMFFPVLFYGIAINFFKYRRFDWVQLFLSACILFLLAWILVGFPSFLSKITLLSMSPAYRTLPVLGVANAFLLVSYLANREKQKEQNFSWLELILFGISVLVFSRLIAGYINKSTDNFFQPGQVMVVTLVIALVYLLIRYSYIAFTTLALALVLLFINLSNLGIHPLTSGLSALLDNPVVIKTRDIQKSDPTARWAVFGNQGFANLLKVNGINVFNGVKAVPMLKDMAVLDPMHKKDSVYNRYAHINLMPYLYNDSVDFRLNENAVVNDNYTISMDPCSPRLGQLGVKYFVFTYPPPEAETRCMTRLADTTGILVFKRKE